MKMNLLISGDIIRSVSLHPDEIIDFLKTVCKFDFNMDMRRGRAVVDAKSLLGIMNLGLNNVIELQMYADDCTELERQLERFAA